MFEAFTLKEDEVQAEEERLREKVRMLSDEQRVSYYREYNKALKDPDTYAALNWFFLAGLHHFYLGRIARGLVNLLLMFAGIMLLFFMTLLGVLILAIVLVMELPALFRSQVLVDNENNRLAKRLLDERHHAIPPR